MRRLSAHILLAVLLLLQGVVLCGQNHVRDAMRRARLQQEALAARNMDRLRSGIQAGGYLAYSVENGDTTYYDTIDPVWASTTGSSITSPASIPTLWPQAVSTRSPTARFRRRK